MLAVSVVKLIQVSFFTFIRFPTSKCWASEINSPSFGPKHLLVVQPRSICHHTTNGGLTGAWLKQTKKRANIIEIIFFIIFIIGIQIDRRTDRQSVRQAGWQAIRQPNGGKVSPSVSYMSPVRELHWNEHSGMEAKTDVDTESDNTIMALTDDSSFRLRFIFFISSSSV